MTANRYRVVVFFAGNKSVLELGTGDGYTTL